MSIGRQIALHPDASTKQIGCCSGLFSEILSKCRRRFIKICGFIKSLLEKYYSKSVELIDEAHNVSDAVKLIDKNEYDLFLFDIQI